MSKGLPWRVVEACELLEKHGPMTARQLSEFTGLNANMTGKHCIKGEQRGWITSTIRAMSAHGPVKVYQASEFWRLMAVPKQRIRSEPVERWTKRNPWSFANSVFNYGRVAA
jgi:hypothetical protein